MSPTLHFPSPFRSRDLPPYGPSDWKRLQPAILRQSLALSSSLSLLMGLLLGYVVQHVAVQQSVSRPVVDIIEVGPLPPPPIAGNVLPTETINPTSTEGQIVARPPDAPDIVEQGPITNQGPYDPDAPLPIGVIGDTGRHDVAQAPERPDPKEVRIVDEPPLPTYQPKPEYPDLARQAGIEGRVTLQVLVDREGKVAEIIRLTPESMFDEKAEKAIRQWRFRPAILHGEPVAYWFVVPVRFVLNDE